MGIGSALGSMVDGYNSASANRRNEEKMDMARTAQAQNQEFNAMRMDEMQFKMDAQKQAYAASQTPEAKQYRAEKMKSETAMFKAKTAFLNEGNSDAAQLQETQNELTQVKMDFENKADVDHTVETKNNMYTTLNEGGQIGDSELAEFNSIIENNIEFLGKTFPNSVAMYNPNNTKHEAGIYDMANKMLQGQGLDMTKFPADKAEELMKDSVDSLKALAEKGYIVADSVTGEAKSIDSLFGQLGNTQRTPRTLVAGINKMVSDTAMEVSTRNMEKRNARLPSVEAWQTDPETGKAEKGPEMWKKKDGSMVDASQYLQRAELLAANGGIPVDKDLEAMVKRNNDSLVKKDGSTKEDSYFAGANPEQLHGVIARNTEALMMGGMDDKETAKLTALTKAGIDKLPDEKQKTQARKSLANANRYRTTTEIFENSKVARTDPKDKAWMVTTESNQAKDLTTDQKAGVSSVRATVAQSERLNTILGRLKDASESGELIVGFGADWAKSSMAKDQGVYDSANEMLANSSNKLDDAKARLKNAATETEVKTARKEVDKLLHDSSLSLDRMIHNTTSIDTALGLELAVFIKEMSGAAVSDQERDFLIDVVQGIQRGRPDVVGAALESFRDQRLAMAGQHINNPNMQMAAPNSMFEGLLALENKGKHYPMAKVNTITNKAMGDKGWVEAAKDTMGDLWNSGVDKIMPDEKPPRRYGEGR